MAGDPELQSAADGAASVCIDGIGVTLIDVEGTKEVDPED